MPSVRSPGIVLCLLLAAALFMRAFLPAGTMAETSERGVIAVKLCNSDGVHLIQLNGDGSTPDDEQRAEPPCAFAGLAAPAVPPPPPLPELAPPVSEALAYDEGAVSADPIARPRLNPPATGPPLPA